ncbi:Os10g0466100 [Oryza sativa Japonica Group]|uniref:Uncharacterized protein n=2 Tax=Oryza sativa subsp. japonica TaxID=39947 RepID=Q7XDM1_ORYSJ|nr:hypothetical protein LOC_Os10g32860 [Oryza sativa Japonica Group]BAF26716.1 Os10g0466100 [Oryza sativa Japonica Group]|eukprot:NP_001064802.1 Os10g0466100 [Oryza sativa Japonica Group]
MVHRFFSCTGATRPPAPENADITLVSGPSCWLSIWSVIVLKCLFVLLHDKKMGIYALIYVLRACRYIEDDEGIRKYFAAFHLLGSFPAAVIIDDFADFFSERSCQQRYGNARARDLAVVRILALCQNAVAHANLDIYSLHFISIFEILFDEVMGMDPTYSRALAVQIVGPGKEEQPSTQ